MRVVSNRTADIRSIHLRPLTMLQAVLILAIPALVIYANSLRNAFVFDDHYLVLLNPQIQDLSQYPRAFQVDAQRALDRPADRGVTHRPLRAALLAVQFHFFGANPTGFRAVSLLLHVLNGVLVFAIFRKVLGRPWPSLFTALIFVVHPVQTESVAYVSGQRDVLFTTFYLAGFLSFVQYRHTQRALWLGAAAAAYVMGLMSKEMAITLPLLCALYDLVRNLPGRGEGVHTPLVRSVLEGARSVVARDKMLYGAAAAVLAAALFYFVFVANPSHQRTLYGGGLGPTLNTSARIVVHYVKQLSVPLTLNADYSYNAFPASASTVDPRGLLAVLILAAIGYGLVFLLRVDRWAAFGGFWFFITLLPVSQIIPHHEMVAEHYLYLPAIGFALVVAHAVERGVRSPRYGFPVLVGCAAILLLLGLRTIVRNRDWKDDLALWTKTVQTAPQAARSRLNLAQALRSNGRDEEAIEQFRVYSTIRPDSPSAQIGMGDIYRQMGRYDDAAAQFTKALELSPESAAAALGLAQTYVAMGESDKATEISNHLLRAQFHDEASYRRVGETFAAAGLHGQAVAAYRKGLELNPLDVALHVALGKAYTAAGQHERALEAYREALKLRPGSPGIRNYLGAAYLETGQLQLATEVFLEAIKLDPDYAEARNNLGITYHRLGRRAEAEAEFRRALALQPDSTEFRQNLDLMLNRVAEPSLHDLERAVRESPGSARDHFNLGAAYGNRGDLARAAQQFERARALDPDNPRIHYAIGLVHAQRGEQALARRAWQRALQLDPTFAMARERLAELGPGGAGVGR
jgi:Flp pilus assembly protein TadD